MRIAAAVRACAFPGLIGFLCLLAVDAPRNDAEAAQNAAAADSILSQEAAPDSTVTPDRAVPGGLIPDFESVPDRWGIEPPPYERNAESHPLDPYNQNRLKGDRPILGQNTFLIVTAAATNLAEYSRAPTPSGVSSDQPDSEPFFGRGQRAFFQSLIKLSIELYHGDTAYRPRDWELRMTPVLSLNRIDTRENNNVHINPRKGPDRGDSHIGFQELFLEKHLVNWNDRYDFASARFGVQRFASDFRHFIFSDFNLGGRLFGSAGSNRYQYNIAAFSMLEKDTNSELNTTFESRDQTVLVANLYRQDTFAPGYTAQLSYHYNNDRPSEHVDVNGVPVRPAILGDARPHDIKAHYLGWAGDGHLGLWNISHAVYQVFGTDDFNPVAGRSVSLNARMAALELSQDRDWLRFRVSGLYASGDADPTDGTAEGFDAIVDQPFLAGGTFGYWNQQSIRLVGVNLVNKASFLPTLRSNKFEGQANFVNPGFWLGNAGLDAELTPKLKLILNASYLSFAEPAVLDLVVNQPDIGSPIGFDLSAGVLWRPFLNNNAVVKVGLASLIPGAGFNDLYDSPGVQYATLAELALVF